MYGHAPGLAQKLKVALKELPKIMPKSGGIFQGDLMYEKSDLRDDGKAFSFTPNTISYSADKESAMGRLINSSKLGIVVHTRYTGKNLEDMKASFDVDQGTFGKDPDVHMINPEISGANIAPIEKKQYEAAIKQATDLYSKMPEDIFNVVDGHDITVKTYINACIRDKSTPNAKGYLAFIKARNKAEVDKMKSPEGKKKKKEKADAMESHIKNHIDSFDAVFTLHGHLQTAKNTLVNALSRVDTGFKTTIGGKPAKQEGFVAIRGGRPTKLVDRAEFSAANFAQGAFRKGAKEEQAAAEDLNPVVTSFGRMNPPTYAGHGAVVSKVKEIADELKAPSVIALSRSQDPEKNPLSPEQKLKHAKRMFPDANIMIADEDAKDMMAHIKKLGQKGHKHLVLVVGSDRVEEMKKLVERYKDDFGFKKVDVVSSGERDVESDKEDTSKPKTDEEKRRGMSATKMRGHAIKGQYREFRAGMHPTASDEHSREMYNDVRQAMDIKIGPDTPMRPLLNHARRKDPIGIKANKELERRRLAAEAEAKRTTPVAKPVKKVVSIKAVAPRKPKPIKEEVGTIGVSGLGLASGNPAVDNTEAGNYVAQNTVDSDQRDNILHLWMKAAHGDHHEKRVGFKEFDPRNKR